MPKRMGVYTWAARRVRRRMPMQLSRSMNRLSRYQTLRNVRRLRRISRFGLYGVGAAAAIGGAALAYRYARRRIGHKKNKSNSKRQLIKQDPVAQPSDTLNQNILTNLGSAATLSRNTRETDSVNIAGWKICLNFRNNSDQPLYVNVAVVSPKDQLTASIPTSDFFRSDASQRGINFDDAGLNALQKHCMAINTDLYNILWHKRFKLAGQYDSSPGPDPSHFSSGYPSYMTMEKFVPLKRQLTFDNTASQAADDTVWLVMWHNHQHDGTGITPASNLVVGKYITTFFRESRR